MTLLASVGYGITRTADMDGIHERPWNQEQRLLGCERNLAPDCLNNRNISRLVNHYPATFNINLYVLRRPGTKTKRERHLNASGRRVHRRCFQSWHPIGSRMRLSCAIKVHKRAVAGWVTELSISWKCQGLYRRKGWSYALIKESGCPSKYPSESWILCWSWKGTELVSRFYRYAMSLPCLNDLIVFQVAFVSNPTRTPRPPLVPSFQLLGLFQSFFLWFDCPISQPLIHHAVSLCSFLRPLTLLCLYFHIPTNYTLL